MGKIQAPKLTPVEEQQLVGEVLFLRAKVEALSARLGPLEAANTAWAAENADLRAYKERTEAGLQLRCEALLELLKDGDVLVRRYAKTEIDWLKQDGLWRDPPQAEVQP